MLFALALLAAEPVLPTVAPPAQDQSDPVICHKPESEVGTHMRPKPVCLKKSEWQFVERNTKDNLHTLRDHDTYDPAHPGTH